MKTTLPKKEDTYMYLFDGINACINAGVRNRTLDILCDAIRIFLS